MAAHKHRTQILLAPQQHQALSEIAAREGRSLSEVVREIIRQHLQGAPSPTPGQPPSNGDAVSERIDAIWRQYGQEQQRVATTSVEEYLADLEQIREHRAAILARRGGEPLDWDVVEEINRMREERDAEILASLNDDRN